MREFIDQKGRIPSRIRELREWRVAWRACRPLWPISLSVTHFRLWPRARATGSRCGGRDDRTATAWSVTIASFPGRLLAHTWQVAVGWKVPYSRYSYLVLDRHSGVLRSEGIRFDVAQMSPGRRQAPPRLNAPRGSPALPTAWLPHSSPCCKSAPARAPGPPYRLPWPSSALAAPQTCCCLGPKQLSHTARARGTALPEQTTYWFTPGTAFYGTWLRSRKDLQGAC